MNEQNDGIKREKVRVVPIQYVDDFPDHPFLVKDDESMEQLVNSIRMNGVLNPLSLGKRMMNAMSLFPVTDENTPARYLNWIIFPLSSAK